MLAAKVTSYAVNDGHDPTDDSARPEPTAT